ncbi:MAG: DUF6069 family protein [Acidipropionibacterium sp.]|nr:DUF6069 family protein [Acidipropionibacterium sp.]
MTESESDTRSNTRAVPRTRLLINDLAVVAAAVICAMITWLVVSPLAGVELRVDSSGRTITVGGGSVALMAASAAIAGLLVLRILEMVSAHGLRIWTVLAIVVAVASLLGALGAVSAAATGGLMALHAVVAVVVIVGGYRAHRLRPARQA